MIARRRTAVTLSCVAAAAIAFGAGQPATAQEPQPTATLRGRVVDQTDLGVPGASIVLFAPETGASRSTETAQDGSFTVSVVKPGRYVLTIVGQGFSPVDVRDLTLGPQDELVFTIHLRIAGVSERVVVTAERAWIRGGGPTAVSVRGGAVDIMQISGDVQRAIPLSPRRDWADFLRFTPGIVSSFDATGSVRYHWHGSDASSHVLRLDGADMGAAINTDNLHFNISPEAIESVEVTDGALDAAAPVGVGAIVNVVTRSGTNLWTGSGAVLYQPQSWNASNVRSGTSQSIGLWHASASAGGALDPNRAWIFVAGHGTDRTIGISRPPEQLSLLQRLAPGFQPFNERSRESSYFVKANGHLARHKVSGYVEGDSRPEDADSPLDAGHFVTRVFGGEGVAARIASAWSGRLTSELSLSFNNKTSPTRAAHTDRPSRPVHAGLLLSSGIPQGTGAIAVLDNVASTFDRRRRKVTLSADAAYRSDTRIGSHALRAGVYLQPNLAATLTQEYVNGGFALEEYVVVDSAVPLIQPFHRRIVAPARVTASTISGRDYAAYVQDQWRVGSRVTLDAGIRVDAVRRNDGVPDAVVPQRANSMPAESAEAGSQHSVEIAPRVAVAFGIDRRARHVVRAGWGRITEALSVTATSSVSPARIVDSYDANLDGNFETNVGGRSAGISGLNRYADPRRHQPFVDEGVVGYRWQPDSLLTIDTQVIRRAYRDRLTLLETNGIFRNGAFVGYENPAFDEIFEVTNNVWNTPVYSGLLLSATHQSRRLRLMANVLRQWRRLAGTWQPHDPARYLQPGTFDNDRGIGSVAGSSAASANSLSGSDMTENPQWRDYAASLIASWFGPRGLTIASSYTFESGPWSGPIVTTMPGGPFVVVSPSPTSVIGPGAPLVANPLATPLRFASTTRGAGQFALPALHVWNVRAGYEFRVRGGRTWPVGVALDLFNLTNASADQMLAAGGNHLQSPNYGSVIVRQPPRAAQISLRLAL